MPYLSDHQPRERSPVSYSYVPLTVPNPSDKDHTELTELYSYRYDCHVRMSGGVYDCSFLHVFDQIWSLLFYPLLCITALDFQNIPLHLTNYQVQ